jgi:hypothetical protein
VPDPRPIDLTAALLLATAALALSAAAGAAFLLLTVVAGSGQDAVTLDGAWTAAGAALATVALLIALTRASVRAAALAAAAAFSAAWPLCGIPLAGALIAMPAIALVVRWGARPAPLPHAAPIAALCATLALVSLGIAAAPHAGEAAGGATSRVDGADARGADAGSAAERADAGVAGRGDARGSDSGGADPGAATDARGGLGGERAVRAAVVAYYRALDRRHFERAWRALSPAVRDSFGGFATWRAGFARTLSSTPRDLRVDVAGDTATVTHRLEARDRATCGVAVQRFHVAWRLVRTGAGWRATTLRGTAGEAPVVPVC